MKNGPSIAHRWIPAPWRGDVYWKVEFRVNSTGYVVDIMCTCYYGRNKILGVSETSVLRPDTKGELLPIVRELMVDSATQQLEFGLDT